MERTEWNSTRNLFSFLLTLVAVALLFAAFMPAEASSRESRGQGSGDRPIMVLLNTDITDSLIIELAEYGKIRGWIERYNIVAMKPNRGMRSVIETLPIVAYVENDAEMHLNDVGTWSLDVIDAVDVEETGLVGDPDAREVQATGAGVHVAVIDTGLAPDWRDFLDEGRVATSLARSFIGGGGSSTGNLPVNQFDSADPTGFWENDRAGHGMAVASQFMGFRAGEVFVDGVAPDAKMIPLKVIGNNANRSLFSSPVIAAIAYVVELVEEGVIGPTVINMSFGGSTPQFLPEVAIDDAIATGIIVVAAAGNDGERGMDWPAAFPQVISAGAVGLTDQFRPGSLEAPNFDFWWTQDVEGDPDRGRQRRESNEIFVAPLSGRAIFEREQELDVLAPGFSSVGPSGDIPQNLELQVPRTGLFYLFGTSYASPMTAGVAALMLERNPDLDQAAVEDILKSTALPVKPVDSRSGIIQPFSGQPIPPGVYTFSWDDDCSGLVCDAVGAGLLQADDALAATPTP